NKLEVGAIGSANARFHNMHRLRACIAYHLLEGCRGKFAYSDIAYVERSFLDSQLWCKYCIRAVAEIGTGGNNTDTGHKRILHSSTGDGMNYQHNCFFKRACYIAFSGLIYAKSGNTIGLRTTDALYPLYNSLGLDFYEEHFGLAFCFDLFSV